MKIDVAINRAYDENTYIVHEDGHVLIIDPGAPSVDILQKIDQKEILDGIILTHGHYDHTASVDDLVDHYDCPVYLHKDDYQLVDPKYCMNIPYCRPIYAPLNSLDFQQTIGKFVVKVYDTPGHTSGSVLVQIHQSLFTGDTLFSSTIGRTDLYSGNEEEMKKSLAFIKTLSKDLIVYPGHGPKTTIKDELMKNPFLLNWVGGI